MNSFWSMGGYGWFVWPSYVAGLVILGGMILSSLRARHAARQALARLEAGTVGRRRRTRTQPPAVGETP